jgi:helicase
MTTLRESLEQEFINQIPFKPDDYQLESFRKINENESKDNFLIVLPTGAGKTLVAEYIIWLSKKNKKRVIYTNPLKALSTEKLDEWNKNHLKHCKIVRDTSDDIKNRTDENYQSFDCLITTNERLNSILRKKILCDMVFKNVEYLIVDEIHLLGSVGRGSTLEFIIMVIRQTNPEIKIVGLSATLPNYKEFSNWLNSELVYLPPDKRPVPLEHYLESPIDLHFGNIKPMNTKEKTTRKTIQLIHITDKHIGEQFLIFVSSRLRAKQLAERFFKRKGIIKSKEITLEDLIPVGVAYHHAGLENIDRNKVEEYFKKGVIKLLFCTPTLAQGVNLPVKNVVLFDISRFNILAGGHQLIYSYEIGQMSGRAGRRGYDNFGRCYYLGTNKEIEHVKESIYNPKPLHSRLYESMDEQILALNVINLANTPSSINELFKKSFLYYQNKNMLKQVPLEVRFLLENDFLKIKSDLRVSYPTKYGSLTSKLYIKPRTSTEILNNIKKLPHNKKLTELDIIKCFLCNGEYLHSIRVSELDKRYIKAAIIQLGIVKDVIVTVYNPDIKGYVKRNLKENFQKAMGLIFADDLKIPVFGSKKEYGVIKKKSSEFIEKTSIPLSLRYEYQSKFQGIEFKVKLAGKMVEMGTLDPKKANIMRIKGIGSIRYRNLIKNNINTVEKFLIENNENLSSILRLKEKTIEKMKEDIMKTMTPEELEY